MCVCVLINIYVSNILWKNIEMIHVQKLVASAFLQDSLSLKERGMYFVGFGALHEGEFSLHSSTYICIGEGREYSMDILTVLYIISNFSANC